MGEVLDDAVARHPALGPVLERCAIWVDGEPATRADAVPPGAEVAVLPPVSGGA